jgi:hypothetical protein
MTFATTCVGLFPIMWATGAGSDVMKRIAAPMVGGIFTSFVLELLVYPAIYEIWRRASHPNLVTSEQGLESTRLRPAVGWAPARWIWPGSIPSQESEASE